MANKLTPKQEKFVQGLVSGLSQRQAYKKAYPNARKWNDNSVDSRASNLFKNDKVLTRYNEIMNEHKEKALWTREEAVEALKWLYKQSITSIEEHDEGYVRQGTSSAVVSAIQELNKLSDLYPESKHNIKQEITGLEIVIGDDDDGDPET